MGNSPNISRGSALAALVAIVAFASPRVGLAQQKTPVVAARSAEVRSGASRGGASRADASRNVAPRNVPARGIEVRGTVTGADVVRAARDYLGVKYVWGGDTPRAFDCSGFTRFVFARYGIALPRTAHEQAAFGDAPFPGDLRPGDLLFFSGGQGAQHIAIYVGGDTIIHASSSAKRVKLDMIKPHGGRWAKRNWFRNRLIAVRRVLPMEGTFYIPMSASTAAPVPAPVVSEGPPSFRHAPTVY
jgi:cell wall-associated NlpC family hydrolase